MANGLGGLLKTGRVQKEQAMGGLLQSARMESQREIQERNLEMQKEAAQQQLIGTTAGIGAAIGATGAAGSGASAMAAAAFGPALIGAAVGFALTKLFD